jgi:hypothetical protein
MAQSKKDVLATLQAELAFVEAGGYRAPQQAAWRPQFIFEDSPTCLNYRNFGKRHPCSQCVLVDFVPNGFKQERFPCRHIPLDDSGQTLDSLYRTATEEEAHAIVARWLKHKIAQLKFELAPEIFPAPEMSVLWSKSDH